MKHFGRFRIEVTNTETGETREAAPLQDNVFLSRYFGLNRAATSFRSIYCFFGTGSSVPDKNNTSLDSPVSGYASTSGDYLRNEKMDKTITNNIYRYELKVKCAASQGSIQGNISELGLSLSSNISNLFTRALIKDTHGNPTTISLGPNDIITVFYSFGFEIDLSNPVIKTKTVTLRGVPTTVTFSWFGYGDNTTGGLWKLGTNLMASTEPLCPPYMTRYWQPFDGTITDFAHANNNTINKVHKVGTSMSVDCKQNGTQLYSVNRYVTSYGTGDSTGTWSGILIAGSSSPFDRFDSKPSSILTFDPPLVKGENDVFKFNALKLFTGEAP